MAKPKHSKEQEFQLGELRKLRAENKALKRKLRHLEKRKHYLEEKETDSEEEFENEVEVQMERCSECSKGYLTEINIVDRIFKKCETCGWRSKARKVNSDGT